MRLEYEQDTFIKLRNVYKKVVPMEMRHNFKEKKNCFYKENASDAKFIESVTSPSNLHLPKNSRGVSYGSPLRQGFTYITDHIALLEDTKNEIKEIFIDLLFQKLSDEPTIIIKDGSEKHLISMRWFCGAIYDGLKLSEIAKEIFNKFGGGQGIYSDNQHNKIIEKAWKNCKEDIIAVIKEDQELTMLLLKMQEFRVDISELSIGY